MESIKNFFFGIKERLRRSGSNPVKTWFLFLEVVGVLFLLSAAFHLLVFFEVRGAREEGKTATTTTSVETIDRQALQKTLDRLEDRRANFDSSIEEASRIADPSL